MCKEMCKENYQQNISISKWNQPALEVGSHKGQKWLKRAKTRVLHGIFQSHVKLFLGQFSIKKMLVVHFSSSSPRASAAFGLFLKLGFIKVKVKFCRGQAGISGCEYWAASAICLTTVRLALRFFSVIVEWSHWGTAEDDDDDIYDVRCYAR